MNLKPYLPPVGEVASWKPGSLIVRPKHEHPAYDALSPLSDGPIARATLIANAAHAAVGQRRADGITPYMVHPIHVAALVAQWCIEIRVGPYVFENAVATALLHDVIEDTKLGPNDLLNLGIPDTIVQDVLTLTKPDESHARRAYYTGCTQRFIPWIVKLADRPSNLLSAAAECIPQSHRGIWTDRDRATNARWRGYVHRTIEEMLPAFDEHTPGDVPLTPEAIAYVKGHLETALHACRVACDFDVA